MSNELTVEQILTTSSVSA